MTQTQHVRQAADAILALINGQPRTPTREQIEKALASFQPAAANDNPPDQPRPRPPLRMRPTKLGWEMIEKLMPAYVEACRYSACVAFSDPEAAELEGWTDGAADAYWGRMREATTLVDMAIAARMAMDGDTPDDLLEMAQREWESHGRHEGRSRPESAEELVGTGALVTYRLVSAILAMAGIDETRCSESRTSQANGWDTEPTPAEKEEWLARVRAECKAAA